jgi:hypothetical protein
VIAATEPQFPLRAVRAVGREQRFVVLAGQVNPEDPPAAGLIVGQQEALLAPQPHGATICRRTGRIYWPTGLLQMDHLQPMGPRNKWRARGDAVSPHPSPPNGASDPSKAAAPIQRRGATAGYAKRRATAKVRMDRRTRPWDRMVEQASVV